jgi:hypothetical protein
LLILFDCGDWRWALAVGSAGAGCVLLAKTGMAKFLGGNIKTTACAQTQTTAPTFGKTNNQATNASTTPPTTATQTTSSSQPPRPMEY